MINAKLKITGPKPNVEKIVSNFLVYNFSIQEIENYILLEVDVPTTSGLKELVRRLKAKKDRKGTVIEIIEMSDKNASE